MTRSAAVFEAMWGQLLKHAPLWLLGSLFLAVLSAPGSPPDDLLRHVVSYAWGYSHTAMYPYTSLPDYNMYPAFDWAAGLLVQAVGGVLGVKLLVAAVYLCGILVIWDALGYWKGALQLSPVHLTGVTLLVLLSGASNRLWLGRPEAWVLCWAIFATTAGKSSLRLGLAAALGCAVSPGYWLAPLFYPVLLASRLPLKKAAGLVALLLCVHVGFWAWWSGGDVWHWPAHLSEWRNNRLFPVLETDSIFLALLQPASVALFLLVAQGAQKSNALNRSLLGLACYCALNLVRFLPAALVCLYGQVLNGVDRLQLSVKAALAVSVCLYLLLLNQLSTGVQLASIPLFQLPQGAVVLTSFSSGVYSLPFANPGRIQVIPGIELGASPRALQTMSQGLESFSLRCEDLTAYKITHVVENRARGTPPTCLRLIRTEGTWRLWEVRV